MFWLIYFVSLVFLIVVVAMCYNDIKMCDVFSVYDGTVLGVLFCIAFMPLLNTLFMAGYVWKAITYYFPRNIK